MTTIKAKKLPLSIQLDPNEIFPTDPGQGTPVLVTFIEPETKEVLTGTWLCVTDTCEIEGYPLNEECIDWLESKRNEVEEWCHKHGV